ncbi:hypothetical protein POM88_007102 [Heracleum sosnowskyi]|uniref:Peptidase M28 domain-containing protein n=1 Tax=Heracleum sosnowskyi TaxID=360622 RepID=A0AAD8J406_9APIA|nr:hypothetical protein POM88_007102 [Heracleum sosnowskyi]
MEKEEQDVQMKLKVHHAPVLLKEWLKCSQDLLGIAHGILFRCVLLSYARASVTQLKACRTSEEPERYVLLGNHRDAWTYGAVDPNSGTATLLDIARRYSLLKLSGWNPRRTIVLCSWDAEEFGMANVFRSKSGACAAFFANYDKNSFAKVAFNNMHYNLPHWSISILPDSKNTVYNTARMGAQSAQMKMTPVSRTFSWQSYNNETTSYEDRTFTAVGLLEHF